MSCALAGRLAATGRLRDRLKAIFAKGCEVDNEVGGVEQALLDLS